MVSVEQANELYEQGLQAFRLGDNAVCIALTTESLDLGRALNDNDIIGQALTGLCRAALRDNDAMRLQTLSVELGELAEKNDDAWWNVVVAHMNAEMARMNKDYDRANTLYEKSMQLSEGIGSQNMVATECFNKAYVALAQQNVTEARNLVARHVKIRAMLDDEDLNPYGLIVLVSLLIAEGDLLAAAIVQEVCSRLLVENQIIPDPADAAPLAESTAYIQSSMDQHTLDAATTIAFSLTCHAVVQRYLAIS